MYRGKANTVGAMRYRITVQKPVKTSLQGQMVVSWVTLHEEEPADYEYVRGYGFSRGRQYEEGVDAVFTVRYRDDYDPEQRTLFEGEYYGIVFVRPMAGRNRYMELHAKVVK